MERPFIFYNNDWEKNWEPIELQPAIRYSSGSPFDAIWNKIAELESLEENWDGYGGVPVLPQIGEKARKFINCLNGDTIEKVTDIFPNPNGTITFEWENANSAKMSLELGENNFSYFIIYPDTNPKLINGQDVFAHIQEITSDVTNLVG